MTEIFHIADRRIWETARAAGVPYTMSTRDLTLDQEGFIHCSADEGQVRGVLDRFYQGVDDQLVLLVIDPAKLTSELRHEPADGQVFPHVYGPLNLDAVIEVRPLPETR
jgi:uncharacterized protein (DUF952 family)